MFKEHVKQLEKLLGPEFKKASRWSDFSVFISLGVLFFLLLTFFLYSTPKPPQDFLVKGQSNQVTQIATLSGPILSITKIQSWSARAVKDIFTFDFTNADAHINSVKHYFTSSGWSQFSTSLKNTNLLKTVKNDQLMVSVTPLSPPVAVANPYYVLGKLVWPDIEVPVLLSYTGSQAPDNQKMVIHVMLVQVNPAENPDGVEIAGLTKSDYQR